MPNFKIHLQFFGGRGASSGGGSSSSGEQRTFSDIDSFENSLTGFDDPRLEEYSQAYETERTYNSGLQKNMDSSIKQDGYDDFTDSLLKSEKNKAQHELNNLPKSKTPQQLGQEKGLKERIDIVNKLRERKGEKPSKSNDVETIYSRK